MTAVDALLYVIGIFAAEALFIVWLMHRAKTQ
jgi:hypothetical protein